MAQPVIEDAVLFGIGAFGVLVTIVLLALNRTKPDPATPSEGSAGDGRRRFAVSRPTRMVFILCGLFGCVQLVMHGLSPEWGRLRVPRSAFWIVGLGMLTAVGLSVLTDWLERRSLVAGDSEPNARPSVPEKGPSS